MSKEQQMIQNAREFNQRSFELALDRMIKAEALNQRLAVALRALVERNGLFIDGPGTVECVYCPASSERHGDPVPHEEGCPIAAGRRVLAELDAKEPQ